MKRSMIMGVLAGITFFSGAVSHAQESGRVIALLEKFDKRMDLLDKKIAGLESRLLALEQKYKPTGYTLSVSTESAPKAMYKRWQTANVASTKNAKVTHADFRGYESARVRIFIGPPPWALPYGPPPGFVPLGPASGASAIRFVSGPAFPILQMSAGFSEVEATTSEED